MENIRSYKELRVYIAAMDAAMRIFDLTKGFPAEERYSLTDQIGGLRAPCALILVRDGASVDIGLTL